MIYVSNLPFTTTDENLRDLFKEFDVKTAYVAVRRNGKSKGFGFVNLAQHKDQEAAVKKVDQKEIDGRKLTAKIAFNDDRRNEKGELKEEFKKQLPPKTTGTPSETVVYVSNLPWAYTNEDLGKLFSDKLKVKSASVATRKGGRSKGFGFVEFENAEDQKKALEKDQLKIEERAITVKPSVNFRGAEKQGEQRPRQQRRPKTNNGGNNKPRHNNSHHNNSHHSNNNNNNNHNNNGPRVVVEPRKVLPNSLYVSNLPFDLVDEDLKHIFQEFHVKSAHIAQRAGGRSKGFGFVEFNNEKDQKAAQEALDQSEVNQRVVSVKLATGQSSRRTSSGPRRFSNNRRHNSSNNSNNNDNNDRRNNNNNRGGNRRPPRRNNENRTRTPSTTLVYVSNLPFSVDDKGLSSLFTGYKVAKAYVAVRRNGRSKGFGFVDFSSHEEQQKALKLNGHEVEGRPLTVQIANIPEARENTNTTNTK